MPAAADARVPVAGVPVADAASGGAVAAPRPLARDPSRGQLTHGGRSGRSSRRMSARMSVTMPHALPQVADGDPWLTILRQEIHLVFGFGAAIFFMIWGDHDKLENQLDTVPFVLCFVWIFCQCIWLAFAVVRHADCLAVQLGEPYGTLILTLSVISIEVIMMAALMITGDCPSLARDMMFAVLMIVINGMLGVTLLIGARRHNLQEYNLTSAQTFINVLIPLAMLSLIMPNYTTRSPEGEVATSHAILLVFQSLVLYGVFLGIQTMRHPDFFMWDRKQRQTRGADAGIALPFDDEAALFDAEARVRSASPFLPGAEPPSPLSNTRRTGGAEVAAAQQAVASELREVTAQNTRLARQLSRLTARFVQMRTDSMASISRLDSVEISRLGSVEEDLGTATNSPRPPATARLLPAVRQSHDVEPAAGGADPPRSEEGAGSHAGLAVRSIPFHTVLLIVSMAPITLLAEKLAALVERVVDDLNAPHAIAGFFVAIIVLSPEGMGAARAAMHNKIQRTVNISLGSALSTIGLTIPAVMVIHLVTGKRVVLGLSGIDTTHLICTLMAVIVTFSGWRTNVLHGVVHLIIFISYIVLIFDQTDDGSSGDGSPTMAPTAAPAV